MRIVHLNYAIAAPQHGADYRSHHLARLWVEAGHSVTIVGSSYSHLLADEIRFAGPFLELHQDGVRYVLLKAPKYKSGVGRALNLFTCMARVRRHQSAIVGEPRPDVVMGASVYQVDNYAARRIAKEHNALFIRETRDLWPLTLFELAGMKPWHPFALLVQHAENYGFRHADMVATTLANSFDHMHAHGLDRERWIYMPQCPNPFEARHEVEIPAVHAQAIARARAEGKFIVIFTGSIVLAADLDTLLNAAKLVENEKVQFFLVGRGPLEESLKQKAAALNLRNLDFLPAVPRSSVPPLLRASDAATVGFLDRPLYRYGVSPNKIFEYLQNGLPVIFYCQTKGDPISESGAGLVVQPENPGALAGAIRALMAKTPEERRAIGQRGRDFVRSRHDLRTVSADYLRLFDQLLLRKRAAPVE